VTLHVGRKQFRRAPTQLSPLYNIRQRKSSNQHKGCLFLIAMQSVPVTTMNRAKAIWATILLAGLEWKDNAR
jgi:hypothetical protein